MKSIKPGRGPSMMGGVVGIFMIGFGLLWTAFAAQASPIFALFGVLWTGIAIAQTVYNFKNATGKKRYSTFDITDENEEPDPFNERFGQQNEQSDKQEERYGGDNDYNYNYNDSNYCADNDNQYCPYCGAKVDNEYRFCNKCGKELPR